MPYILKRYYPARNIFFFCGEGLLIFLAIAGVYHYQLPPLDRHDYILLFLRAGIVTATFQLCLYYLDLYDLSVIPPFSDTLARITQAFGLGCIALAGIYYLFPAVIISTRIFWYAYFAICLMVSGWRILYSQVLERRMFAKPVLVVGSGDLAGKIGREISSRQDCGYRIAGFWGQESAGGELYGAPVFDLSRNLLELSQNLKAEKVVVALDDQRGTLPIRQLLECKLAGMPIVTGVSFYEELAGKILVEKVNPSWLIYSEGFLKTRFLTVAKRGVDLLVSAAGLCIAAPIMLISACIIKLESPGPVFYVQDRVGANGRVFKVVKFRSMTCDAEKDGPVWAAQNDTRTTRYGAFMRKTRIDEIPPMWNVLKGEMSFVGPRPERPVFVERLEKIIPYYSLRHSVKPGLTGWAQIFYPYGASEEDALRKLEYDLYYIKNMTLRMDLFIIFKTVQTVLFRKGGR